MFALGVVVDDLDEFLLVSFAHEVMAMTRVVLLWRVIELNRMLPIHWCDRIRVTLALDCVHLLTSGGHLLLISLGLTDPKLILDALQNEVELLEIWHRVLLEHLQVALVLVGFKDSVHDKLIALISKLNFIVLFYSSQNP